MGKNHKNDSIPLFLENPVAPMSRKVNLCIQLKDGASLNSVK